MTMGPTEEQEYTAPPPVTPYPELLPLHDHNLPWERFEAFCEGLISRLPGVKETHRYGRRGSNQRGIDIFADFDNGERWAFQCRQWKRFTKTDATNAISRTSYEADRFTLMLSGLATSGVRDACDGHTSWDVWDVGDISRKVKELQMHSAARLVEVHFGTAWRRAFLGLQGLAPFVKPSEFFDPFLNTPALFNHAWRIVGRSHHLHRAHEFVESQQQQVAILVGRGGIGKTKILHTLAETFDDEHRRMSLWFVAEGVPLTQDGADHLPFEPCVVVVDDAHRRSDLPALLALSRQRPHVTKLFLSCRPQGIDYVRSQLTQGGFGAEEVLDLPEVDELSREEVKELGRQALGTAFADRADQLAAATSDCPLVTVVGGQLLAKKAIPPGLLARDEEFRQTVLGRFREILVGQVGDQDDAVLCKSLLDLIAAVQPIRLDNEKTLEVEAEFLGIDRTRLLRSLDALEEAGVLLRRGNALRIVPDVLADHILHEASVTSQGQPTGFADRVFDKFASLCPSEVLRNLAELDWRLRKSDAQASDLLGGVWQRIEQGFREVSHLGRCNIIRILGDVAVYQPERVLELVEYAIRSPATKSEDPELSRVYEFTHSDVLVRLPALLRQICHIIGFLPRCCKLLWELGRDDDHDLNPHPDHAMRVLADLGSYDIGKPFVVNHRVLDAVQNMLEVPGIHDHVHSPLDIIEPMLEKTGLSTHSEGYNLVLRPFALSEESIRSIRQRAISLVVRCLSSDSLRGSLRALDSLENALREPLGALDLEITDEDREQWRHEQLEILTHIAGLAERPTEPVTLLRIKEVLQWHRTYSPSDDVRDRANAIVSSIPQSFEIQLTQELMNPYHMRDWRPDEEGEDDGYRLHREQVQQMQRNVVMELLGLAGDADTAYRILADRIQILNDARVKYEPRVILGILGDFDPEFAAKLCDIIVDNPNGALAPYLPPLLSNVRISNAERARRICQRALGDGADILRCGVALSYQSWGWADNATARDIGNIRELLGSEDMGVRRLAIGSLASLAQAHQGVAIDLAKGIEVGDSSILAAELCKLFSSRWGVPVRELTADYLKAFLSRLEDVQDIEEFHINAFLVEAAESDAQAVVGLLLNRIKKAGDAGSGYRALPTLGFQEPLKGLATGADQEKILREIRDASLESGWSIKWWIPQLFQEVSSGSESAASLKVLEEWINSGSTGRIKSAAHLVSGAKPAFVFKHVEFITNLLERAHAASSDCYRSVTSSLACSALSGTRSGTPGRPMPQDVAIKDQASEVAGQFDAGSPAYSFYTFLAESAKANIRNQLLRDEEFFE